MKTQVMVLHGGSSSGRSAVARDLQAVLAEPWLSLNVDTRAGHRHAPEIITG